MSSETIEIIVTPKGETRVETKGFAGNDCRQASQFIEQVLGQKTSEQLTAEFHQQGTQSSHLDQARS